MNITILYRGQYRAYMILGIFCTLVLCNALVDAIAGHGTYEHSYVYDGFGFALATAVSYMIYKRSQRIKPRLMIDTETASPVRIEPHQTLLLIPLRLWPWLCAAVSLLFFILWLTGAKPH